MKRASLRKAGTRPEHTGLEGIVKKKGKEPEPPPPPPKKLPKMPIDVRIAKALNALCNRDSQTRVGCSLTVFC